MNSQSDFPSMPEGDPRREGRLRAIDGLLRERASKDSGLDDVFLADVLKGLLAQDAERTKQACRGRSRFSAALKASLALAASIAAACGIWQFGFAPQGLPRVTAIQGHAWTMRGAECTEVKEGMILPANGKLRVDAGAFVEAAYPDGTRIRFSAGTEAVLSSGPDGDRRAGKKVFLASGRLSAETTRQPAGRPMILTTLNARATVMGTRFVLAATPQSTRLEVEEGKIEFMRLEDAAAVMVSGGEWAAAASGVPFQAAKLENKSGGGVKSQGKVLFQEFFEDDAFESRGWYDMVAQVLSGEEHLPESNFSAEYRFLKNRVRPLPGGAIRRRIPAVDGIRIGYWVKHSSNWVVSPDNTYQIRLLTNENSDWEGPGYTRLTVSIGFVGGYPAILIQDAQNLDETRVGEDLVKTTEDRAVAGGNGDADGYGEGFYYPTDSPAGKHSNCKSWSADENCFRDERGPYYKGDWHHVEVFVKLNTVADGKSLADGQARYWFDGKLMLDRNDVVFRTAVHADMKFNQLLIAPYIDSGALADQAFWLDDLSAVSDGPH